MSIETGNNLTAAGSTDVTKPTKSPYLEQGIMTTEKKVVLKNKQPENINSIDLKENKKKTKAQKEKEAKRRAAVKKIKVQTRKTLKKEKREGRLIEKLMVLKEENQSKRRKALMKRLKMSVTSNNDNSEELSEQYNDDENVLRRQVVMQLENEKNEKKNKRKGKKRNKNKKSKKVKNGSKVEATKTKSLNNQSKQKVAENDKDSDIILFSFESNNFELTDKDKTVSIKDSMNDYTTNNAMSNFVSTLKNAQSKHVDISTINLDYSLVTQPTNVLDYTSNKNIYNFTTSPYTNLIKTNNVLVENGEKNKSSTLTNQVKATQANKNYTAQNNEVTSYKNTYEHSKPSKSNFDKIITTTFTKPYSFNEETTKAEVVSEGSVYFSPESLKDKYSKTTTIENELEDLQNSIVSVNKKLSKTPENKKNDESSKSLLMDDKFETLSKKEENHTTKFQINALSATTEKISKNPVINSTLNEGNEGVRKRSKLESKVEETTIKAKLNHSKPSATTKKPEIKVTSRPSNVASTLTHYDVTTKTYEENEDEYSYVDENMEETEVGEYYEGEEYKYETDIWTGMDYDPELFAKLMGEYDTGDKDVDKTLYSSNTFETPSLEETTSFTSPDFNTTDSTFYDYGSSTNNFTSKHKTNMTTNIDVNRTLYSSNTFETPSLEETTSFISPEFNTTDSTFYDYGSYTNNFTSKYKSKMTTNKDVDRTSYSSNTFETPSLEETTSFISPDFNTTDSTFYDYGNSTNNFTSNYKTNMTTNKNKYELNTVSTEPFTFDVKTTNVISTTRLVTLETTEKISTEKSNENELQLNDEEKNKSKTKIKSPKETKTTTTRRPRRRKTSTTKKHTQKSTTINPNVQGNPPSFVTPLTTTKRKTTTASTTTTTTTKRTTTTVPTTTTTTTTKGYFL